MSKPENKTISLHDFEGDEEFLADLITEALEEKGINAVAFAYTIEVEYTEEEDE